MLFAPTDKQLRLLFYATWLVILLVQCALVSLSGDEAYYWRYSQQLAWGYFDHPPLTAVLIKAGYALMQNELGVRFFFALLVTGFIYLVERIVNPSNLRLYYAIVLSVAFLQIGMVWGGGMMALPDFPLLFLEAAFFLLYQRYLERPVWAIYVGIPIVAALMLLTKYHGILVIGFVVLSNLRLLGRPSFWLMCAGTAVLLAPHLMWQVTNDFPSVRYHLFERSANPYSINYTLEYIGTLPLITGPLIGFILIYCALTIRPAGLLDRGLKFTVIGTYLFFLLMSFNGRIEGNWTIVALVPLLYLGYKTIEESEKLRRLTLFCFFISFPLMMIIRIVISAHLPVPIARLTEQLAPESWCTEIEQRTGGKPAVFLNSYQRASLYEFYQGIPSYSMNNFWGRKNQYTLWDTEASFQGKSVALVSNWELSGIDSVWIENDYYPYLTIENFRASSNLRISSDLVGPVECSAGDTIATRIRLSFDPRNSRDLEANIEYPTTLVYGFFQGTNSTEVGNTGIVIKNDMIGGSEFPVEVVAPASGRYFLQFAAATGWLPPGINSQRVEFIVE